MTTNDHTSVSDDPVVLTLTELRVLSGLSRGAAMPFDDEVSIGSDFACDLILVDAGIEERHATLSRQPDGGYLLSVLTPGRGTNVPVEHGEPFEMAGIRMVVAQSDEGWDFALPVSAPVPLSDIEQAVATAVAAGRLGPGATSKTVKSPSADVKRMVTIAVCALAVGLVGWLIYLYVETDAPAAPPPPAIVQRVYTESEVQAIATAFAARLDELNIPALKLVTAPQQLTIQGLVDRAAESRFEAAVQELRETHPGLKVRLELGAEGSSVLPFEITAAVGGSSGSVLLADGQQLFVGAEEAGFKFLGLVGNCLNFLHVATQQKVSQCSDQKSRRR